MRRTWSIARPARSWLGVGLLAALVIAEGLLVRRWQALPVSVAGVLVGLGAIVGAAAIIALALRLASCLAIRYTLDQNTVIISRGTARWVVPLCALERVAIGAPQAVLVDRSLLPGFAFGRGYVPDGGPALFFATRQPAECVVLQTESCTYLLSPADAAGFVAAVEAQRALAGPAHAQQPAEGYLVVLRRPWALALLGAAIVANAALAVYMAWWYPALPDSMPLHFNGAGVADRWGPAAALFWLPQIGALVIAANLLLSVLSPLRRSAYTAILLASALLVQAALWVAFVSLLP